MQNIVSIYIYIYFAAISVASSVQVTLQLYFQIFYSTAPNKIVIKLTKLRQTVKLKYLEDKKQLVKKIHSAEEIIEACSCRISVEKI